MARNRVNEEAVVVIGLGRFGGTLAESLAKSGNEVLGIDSDMKTVQEYSDRLTHVVQADSTDEDALRQLGVAEFQRAVVGIGSIEASVLTVVALADLQIPQIWAKALSARHAKILETVGAQHVVRPETTMGERIAHLITGKMLDYFEFEPGFAIAKVRKPAEAQPEEYGVKVIAEPREGEIIVAGTVDEVRRFAAIT